MYKCLACVGENIAWANKPGRPSEAPVIRDAITLAPQWISQQMMGQMIMSAVAVPTCYEHLNVSEKTPIQKASESGLWIGGQAPQ